jgi:hypothetical protein
MSFISWTFSRINVPFRIVVARRCVPPPSFYNRWRFVHPLVTLALISRFLNQTSQGGDRNATPVATVREQSSRHRLARWKQRSAAETAAVVGARVTLGDLADAVVYFGDDSLICV